jgi:hypothetical protein
VLTGCSDTRVKFKSFLDVLVRNKRYMFSPSKDPSDEGNNCYRTCLQELQRLQLPVGVEGSVPDHDELLPAPADHDPGLLRTPC